MTERTETTETAPPPDAAAINELTKDIAERLAEPNVVLLRTIIEAVGPEQTQALLAQTLEIEAGEGLMLKDGSRRRTPGGVFMFLARRSMPKRLERKIWPAPPKAKTPGQNTTGQGQQSKSASVPPLAWDEAKQIISQAIQSIGEARTVKITLIGRPGRVVQQTNCVVVAMKGKEPPSLPKGLPTPPVNSAITWAVFIATKQWAKVKDSLQENKDDQLIIEGYPLIDPKSSASVVLATSVKSLAQERAQREVKHNA